MVNNSIFKFFFSVLIVTILVTGWKMGLFVHKSEEPIRIGILHSTSGTMAGSEKPLIEAVEMAISELNAEGGLLGRTIEPIVMNPNSDPKTFAAMAESLIVKEKVEAIFGCWTSSSRKQVRPIMEKHKSILFYPVQYEGLEASKNIVYTGANPNQQILPAISWAIKNVGPRVYIVGSDYVFPRVASIIMQDHLKLIGAELVGESYVLLGEDNVSSIVKAIKISQPDVILNTLNGGTNKAFFKELRLAGISSEEIPTISFSVSESELPSFPGKSVVGDYLAWSYFQGLDTKENHDFVRRFQKFSGNLNTISDPMVASYFGVQIWAEAVVAAQSPLAEDVLAFLPDRSLKSPSGLVYLNKTNHTWLPSMIGQIQSDNSINIVWESKSPIQPIPFPPGRTKREWLYLLSDLRTEWNGSWQNSMSSRGGS